MLILLLLTGSLLLAGEHPDYRPRMKSFKNLSGTWRYSIGDRKEWRNRDFDHREWEEIRVPATWEDQGFHGYNGFAWYRKEFYLDQNLGDKSLMLILGYIDDADEVYLNGELIGASGTFPPYFKTAFAEERRYPLRHDMLRKGEKNVIAIRVYDAHLAGGIVRGEIGLFELVDQKEPALNLAGLWKFRIGDLDYVPDQNNFGGKPISVPGHWENKLNIDYNGYAWYQRSFCLPPELKGKRLVLVLGKIDDTDMVFINGKQIGATGLTWNGPLKAQDRDSWEKRRTYLIPQNVLAPDGNNIISVRIHNWIGDGGIYQGPVGIIKQENLVNFLKG